MSKTITKANIVERVEREFEGKFSKKQTADLVDKVLDSIKTTLEQEEQLKISGFGNFVVRKKSARIGRNPQTGGRLTISARRVLTFKASQILRREINRKNDT